MRFWRWIDNFNDFNDFGELEKIVEMAESAQNGGERSAEFDFGKDTIALFGLLCTRQQGE
jgi:hypothetical protein